MVHWYVAHPLSFPPMALTPQEVEHLAQLVRIQLDPEQQRAYQEQLTGILAFVEQLQQVEMDGVEPTYHVTGMHNRTRPDHVVPFGQADALVDNAPVSRDRYVIVPVVHDR